MLLILDNSGCDLRNQIGQLRYLNTVKILFSTWGKKGWGMVGGGGWGGGSEGSGGDGWGEGGGVRVVGVGVGVVGSEGGF